jgi:hypothetical protein
MYFIVLTNINSFDSVAELSLDTMIGIRNNVTTKYTFDWINLSSLADAFDRYLSENAPKKNISNREAYILAYEANKNGKPYVCYFFSKEYLLNLVPNLLFITYKKYEYAKSFRIKHLIYVGLMNLLIMISLNYFQ